MSLTELYLFIFFDEIISALLLPTNQRYVLSTALILNDLFNVKYAFMIAFLGSLIGAIANYSLVKIIVNGLNFRPDVTKKIFVTVLISLVLVPFNYWGPVFSAFAAMIKLKFAIYFKMIFVVYLIYYLISFFTAHNIL